MSSRTRPNASFASQRRPRRTSPSMFSTRHSRPPCTSTTPKMNGSHTSRARASLAAHLINTSRRTVGQTRHRAVAIHQQHRAISSSASRWQQQPSPAPAQRPASATYKPNASNNNNLTPETSGSLRSLTDGLVDPPPTLDESERQVDWTRSYHGLSSTPFTAEQSAILQAELDPEDIEIKPDGILYLPEIKYRRILNKTFGPGGWGLAPRGETIVTGKLVTREYGLVCGGR
jgi:hypothetical protein